MLFYNAEFLGGPSIRATYDKSMTSRRRAAAGGVRGSGSQDQAVVLTVLPRVVDERVPPPCRSCSRLVRNDCSAVVAVCGLGAVLSAGCRSPISFAKAAVSADSVELDMPVAAVEEVLVPVVVVVPVPEGVLVPAAVLADSNWLFLKSASSDCSAKVSPWLAYSAAAEPLAGDVVDGVVAGVVVVVVDAGGVVDVVDAVVDAAGVVVSGATTGATEGALLVGGVVPPVVGGVVPVAAGGGC